MGDIDFHNGPSRRQIAIAFYASQDNMSESKSTEMAELDIEEFRGAIARIANFLYQRKDRKTGIITSDKPLTEKLVELMTWLEKLI